MKMMSMWRLKRQLWYWQFGRQGTGYEVFTLINSKKLNFDCHLIRYPVGASIPAHVDPVSRGDHYRLNIEIWRPKAGGELICSQSIWRRGRINLFRPDKAIHAVTEVKEGIRYVLSIGWVK